MIPVSVIIPTYNRSKLLKRAIESVISQVAFSGEIVVVDDGSTDTTKELVTSYSEEADIQLLSTANHGPAAARNHGVRQSKYAYIAFLDSDDHWHKKKLAVQVEQLLNSPEYRISHTQEKWFRRGQHLNQKNIHRPQHGYIFEQCLKLCAVGMSTVVMEKNLFLENGGFDETLPCCEDYDLWLRISCQHQFLLCAEPLTIKEGGRQDQLSYIYRIGMDKFRIYSLVNLIESDMLTLGQADLASAELITKCQIYGYGCNKHGRIDEGQYYLNLADHYAGLKR